MVPLPSLLRRLETRSRQRMVTWSSFMVPVEGCSGSSLRSQTGTPPSQSGRALLANGKGVLTVNNHCPFLLISGAPIKNGRKYTHSLWEFSREEIYCFSPLQELFFFSLPLAATCVFVTTLFCSSSTKRSGWLLNRNRSFLRMGHTTF